MGEARGERGAKNQETRRSVENYMNWCLTRNILSKKLSDCKCFLLHLT